MLYPTEKQKEIIELAYKFRFINRHHVQKLLNHKDARRINAWLKELTEYNFLGRIYSHKLLENTKPAIYYLSGEGIRFIQKQHKFELKDVKKFYGDKKASQKFIDHCIVITEFFVKMKVYERISKNTYTFKTKTECYTNEVLNDLKPDLYMEKTKKRKKDSFFMDIFDPHVPRYALRYRIKQYIEFYEHDWDEEYKFPYVLLVLPNAQKIRHLRRYTQKQEYDSDIIFQFTTQERLLKEEIEAISWETVSGD